MNIVLTTWLPLAELGCMLNEHCFNAKPVFILNPQSATT